MKAFMLLGLLIVGAVALSADEADKAIGYWKSISDVKGEEGKVTAIWQLTVDAKGVLSGTIVYVPNKPANETYTTGKKEYKGKPIRGTFWMTGLKKTDKNAWTGGTIVDVGNEKADVYGCEIHVIDGGKKLDMRGYIGFAFIGRSQVWQTISEDETKSLIANQVN